MQQELDKKTFVLPLLFDFHQLNRIPPRCNEHHLYSNTKSNNLKKSQPTDHAFNYNFVKGKRENFQIHSYLPSFTVLTISYILSCIDQIKSTKKSLRVLKDPCQRFFDRILFKTISQF